MIVWSGLGVLALVFAVAGGALGAALQPMLAGAVPGLPRDAGLAAGLVLAAAVNWWVGVRLNSDEGRELIDPQTGQRVVLRRRHTPFWIPMQYASILMVVFAAAALSGSIDTSSSRTPRGTRIQAT